MRERRIGGLGVPALVLVPMGAVVVLTGLGVVVLGG